MAAWTDEPSQDKVTVWVPEDNPYTERDELDDRLADQRRQDLGWLVKPLEDDGYW